MNPATARDQPDRNDHGMPRRVAIVSRNEQARLEVARAFDDAPEDWIVDIFEDAPPDAEIVVAGPDVESLEPGAAPVVRFDRDAPDRVIADVATALGRASKSYFVTGAWGGAGATTVAVHLAALWAGQCVLVEVAPDSGPSRMALRLGLPEVFPRPIEETSPLPCPPGFALLSVRPGAGLSRAIPRLQRDFDRVLVVDSIDNVDLRVPWTGGLCVMSPTLAAARRARWLRERIPESVAFGVVVNRTGRGGETTRAEIHDVLGWRIALDLPTTARLRDAEAECRLLGRWSRWSWSIAALHAALDRT